MYVRETKDTKREQEQTKRKTVITIKSPQDPACQRYTKVMPGTYIEIMHIPALLKLPSRNASGDAPVEALAESKEVNEC